MGYIYAWLLMALLSPAAKAGVPADALLLVDPMDPIESSLFVDAVFSDIPRGIVTDLCLVESGGCTQPKGVHRGDSGHSDNVRRKAFARGKLAAWCPLYWGPGAYSTRGNHGSMFAYTARYLGPCIPLDTLDVPFFSALGTALRVREVCRNHYNRETRRLRGDGLPRNSADRDHCSADDVRAVWAGKAKPRREVIARWRDRLDFWLPRARWRTDWRGRCQGRTRKCSSDYTHRPTLEDFRRRRAGKIARW